VLIDFGIARFYRPGSNNDTSVYGTLGYAPPEQYGKGQTDARTDIYALGVLLHHMLTGHDPSVSPFALPAPRALNPALPAAVAAAIERATANDRTERFADIAAFRAALRAPAPPPVVVRPPAETLAVRPAPPTQAPAQAPAESRRMKRRARAPLWAFALVAVVLIGALLAFTLARSSAGQDVGGLELAATELPAALDSTEAAVPTEIEEPTASLEPTEEPAPTSVETAPTETPEVEGTPGQAKPIESLTEAEVVPIRPERVSASSSAPSNVDSQGNRVTYIPENAIDGKKDTTWRVEHDGVDQWLQLDFASEVAVWKIGIIPGYDKIDPYDGTDRFLQNRVVKRVRLEFSDGTTQEASFEQRRDMQFVPLPQAVRTRFVRIVILETYPPLPAPSGRDFTPISEVVVEGTL
jgi:serine/threonine protein kinase